MLPDTGLTYSRYPRPGTGSLYPVARLPDDKVAGRERAGPATEVGKPAEPEFQPWQLGGALGDLALRLNQKVGLYRSEVQFVFQDQSRRPYIDMIHQSGEVVSRFEAGDVLELERNLYDMAGFHFSLET